MDRLGGIWVAQWQSNYFGGWDGRQWHRSFLAASLFPGLQSLTRLRNGNLLLVRTRELVQFDGDQVISRLPLLSPLPDDVRAWSVNEDHLGTVWICTQSMGLYRVQPSGAVRHFTAANGLTYDGLRFTFEDREHNLWVGSGGGGLMRFKARTFAAFGQEHGLAERNVKGVLEEAPGKILIATYGKGLFRWDGQRISVPEIDRQPFSEYAQCLLQDLDLNVWVGGLSGTPGLTCLTMLTKAGRRAVPPAESGGSSINALFCDSRGRVWVGGRDGVSVFENGHLALGLATNNAHLHEACCFAEEPRQGAIWAAGPEGLNQFAHGQWREIKDPAGQSLNDILCLRSEPEGALWVGEAGVGLLRFSQNHWSSVTDVQGLPTRNISCIIEDEYGYWWLGSNRGVVRASKLDLIRVADGALANLPCQVFNLSDGLPSVECASGYQSAALKDSQGRIWFATIKGVAMVDPATLDLNTNPPPVRLEGFSYLDQTGKRVDPPARKILPSQDRGIAKAMPLLTIPPGSRQLEARFAALSFVAPEKVRLKYRWVQNGKTFLVGEGVGRTVTSQWLPPGNYQLRVTAANNDSVWNEEGATLAFVVEPFYWQTLWFRILAALGFGGMVAASVGKLRLDRLRRTEELLRQQRVLAVERGRAAALTQYASDIILLLNADGQVIYESPSTSRILGYAEGHLLGKDPLEFVHPDDRSTTSLQPQGLPRDLNPGLLVTFRFLHAQGHWVQLEALATNLLDHPGVLGIMVTMRDLTERKRAELERQRLQTQLIQAQKMEAIGQLAGGVAHDFNNILTAMLMQLALLQDDAQMSAEARTGLQELETEAQRAAHLTRQLLLFSRRQVMQFKPLELNALLGNLLKMLRRLIGEQITLEFNGAADDLWVEADPGMIEQVVMNLVVNARDAMPKGGRVVLTTQSVELGADSSQRISEAYAGRFACLAVGDVGCGMDEATVKRIFEPFFTTKELGKGTGLGLATVFGIVKQHRGWLEVESTPGQGSTFTIYLPAQSAQPAAAPESAGSESTRGGSETLLLVEDEPSVRHGAASMLRQLGYQVTDTGSGPEALQIWEHLPNPPDLLITDVVMPGGISGLELTQTLRRRNPKLKVILISGYSAEMAAHGLPSGERIRFLQKPFPALVLARMVRDCLDCP